MLHQFIVSRVQSKKQLIAIFWGGGGVLVTRSPKKKKTRIDERIIFIFQPDCGAEFVNIASALRL